MWMLALYLVVLTELSTSSKWTEMVVSVMLVTKLAPNTVQATAMLNVLMISSGLTEKLTSSMASKELAVPRWTSGRLTQRLLLILLTHALTMVSWLAKAKLVEISTATKEPATRMAVISTPTDLITTNSTEEAAISL